MMPAYTAAESAPDCCGSPMYLCTAEHTDGKRYFHCHSCHSNAEVRADEIERT